MSIFRERKIPCPHCGATASRSIALSVDGRSQPEARRAILDDRFQRYLCAGCGGDYQVDAPFAFYDVVARQFVAVYPSAWEGSWRAVEREGPAAFELDPERLPPSTVAAIGERFLVRAVFGLAALRDKLVCFDAGLDDHGLEVFKLDLLRRVKGLSMDPRGRLHLKRVTAADMTFTGRAPDEDGTWRSIELTVDRERMRAIMSDDSGWALTWQSVSGGAYVDTGRVMIEGRGPPPR